MSGRIQVLALGADAAGARALAQLLSETLGPQTRVHATAGLDGALSWMRDIAADAVVCAHGAMDHTGVAQMRATYPALTIFILDEDAPQAGVPWLEAGADDVLSNQTLVHAGKERITQALARRQAVARLLRSALERLEAGAQQRLDETLIVIRNLASHELATPLTPMHFDLESLRARAQQLGPQEEKMFERLDRNLARLEQALQQLRDQGVEGTLDKTRRSFQIPGDARPVRPAPQKPSMGETMGSEEQPLDETPSAEDGKGGGPEAAAGGSGQDVAQHRAMAAVGARGRARVSARPAKR